MIIKKCKNCDVDFKSKKRTKQHCSINCFKQYRARPAVISESVKKRRESSLLKYGTDNPAKSKLIKQKTMKTCIARYGVVSPTLVKAIHKKQIATNIKRYGVKNPQQNAQIRNKQQTTLLKNHNVLS